MSDISSTRCNTRAKLVVTPSINCLDTVLERERHVEAFLCHCSVDKWQHIGYIGIMPMLLAITVYSVDDVCKELAERTGWHKKYSRQNINKLIKRRIPSAQKIGNRYFITEPELNWLVGQLQVQKRHVG